MASERRQDVRDAAEEPITRVLRGLILVIIALGVLAAIFGSRSMRWFLPMIYLPVAIAYPRPRWAQILIWIMWATSFGLLAILVGIGHRPTTLSVPSHWFLMSAGILLFVGLPLLRWALESGRFGSGDIPQARIHRRE